MITFIFGTIIVGFVLLITSNIMHFGRTKDKKMFTRFWLGKVMLTKNEYILNRVSLGLALLGIIALIALTPVFKLKPIRIYGQSMAPTLNEGDRGTISQRVNEINQADIIVFRSPERPNYALVLQVIGLPGETISIDENGQLYVGNTPLNEPYLDAEYNQKPESLSNYVLAENEYWVIG